MGFMVRQVLLSTQIDVSGAERGEGRVAAPGAEHQQHKGEAEQRGRNVPESDLAPEGYVPLFDVGVGVLCSSRAVPGREGPDESRRGRRSRELECRQARTARWLQQPELGFAVCLLFQTIDASAGTNGGNVHARVAALQATIGPGPRLVYGC